MMANNWQRLNIWLKLNNRFDYAEYVAACTVAGCPPHDRLEFAQKAGMVSAGLATYPELPVAEAYLKFVSANQQAFTPPAQQATSSPQQGASANLPFTVQKVMITFEDGHTEEQEIRVVKSTGCCGGGTVK